MLNMLNVHFTVIIYNGNKLIYYAKTRKIRRHQSLEVYVGVVFFTHELIMEMSFKKNEFVFHLAIKKWPLHPTDRVSRFKGFGKKFTEGMIFVIKNGRERLLQIFS